MKFTKITFILLTFLLSISSLSAKTYKRKGSSCLPKACPKEPVCCEVPKAPENCSYNCPARIDVCGNWDMFITGSFIYLQPYQAGMDEAVFSDVSNSPTRSEIIKMNFDYKPGFKVGIGYNFKHDNWSCFIEYMRYKNTNTTNVSIPSWVGGINFGWFSPTNFAGFLYPFKTRFKINLNLLNLELSRWEYRGKNLIFNPYFGLKGGFFDESLKANFTQGITGKNTVTSDSWLIGPRFGFYSKWLLCHGFNLFNTDAISLVYQKFSNLKSVTMDINNNEIKISSNDRFQITPILEILLGMNWGSYFNRNNYHFDISLAYELQYYWSQNYVKYVFNTSQTFNDDLSLHGLNLSLRFDF